MVQTGARMGALVAALFFVASLGAACGDDGEADETTALRATVSILPQQYLLERIGGDRVSVNVMVPPGSSPATYEPVASQMRELADADLYFSIDVPFERAWLDRFRAANDDMVVVDTTEGVERRTYPNDVVDPHVWLSPRRVKVQARTVADALIENDPDGTSIYAANLEALLEDVDALDETIAETLAPFAGAPLMQFHPAWDYYAEDYGLVAISIEVGGQEPSAKELVELIELAEREDIRAIVVQPQFSARDAETIASQVGAEVLTLDPLAEDWLRNLEEVTRELAEVLGERQ